MDDKKKDEADKKNKQDKDDKKKQDDDAKKSKKPEEKKKNEVEKGKKKQTGQQEVRDMQSVLFLLFILSISYVLKKILHSTSLICLISVGDDNELNL